MEYPPEMNSHEYGKEKQPSFRQAGGRRAWAAVVNFFQPVFDEFRSNPHKVTLINAESVNQYDKEFPERRKAEELLNKELNGNNGQNQYDKEFPERQEAEKPIGEPTEQSTPEIKQEDNAAAQEDIKAIRQRFTEGWKQFAKDQLAKGKTPEEIKIATYKYKSLKDFIERPDKDEATRPKFEKENENGAEPETDIKFYKSLNKNLSNEVQLELIDKAILEAKREFDSESEKKGIAVEQPAPEVKLQEEKQKDPLITGIEKETDPHKKRVLAGQLMFDKARALADTKKVGGELYKKALEEWTEADKIYKNIETGMLGKNEQILNPVAVELRKNGLDISKPNERTRSSEKIQNIADWTKQRLTGVLQYGMWDLKQAITFQRGKKTAGKELAEKSKFVKRTENLNLEEAWEEASRIIKANLAIEGKPGDRGPAGTDYERLSETITAEKKAQNNIFVDYAVKQAEDILRKKLKNYSDEFGRKPDETKIGAAMEALKIKMLELQNGAIEADTGDFSKIIKEKIDPKYLRRYIYAGAEAAAAFSGWYFLYDAASGSIKLIKK